MSFIDGLEINFIWQHCFRGRWLLYNDKDLKILNKAINKNQKTLQLPSNDPSQQIRVNFDQLVQKNKISSIEQKIRPVMYGVEYVSWMWIDRDDSLNSYKPKVVFLLEVAYQRGEKMFKYYDQYDYTIDLSKFQEINENINAIRFVIREVLCFSTISKEIFDISVNNSLFRKMCLDKSLNFQTRCIVNLSTLSSLSSRMSCCAEEIIIPERSFSLSEEDIERKMDPNLTVDIQCPNKNNFHIYSDKNVIFSATLSFVNLRMNQNKFCIIQLLQQNDICNYILLQRYGRVGTKGRCVITNQGNLLNSIIEFEDKFYKKTKNRWIDQTNFVYVPGSYNYLKIGMDNMDTKPEEFVANCDLHPAIQSLLELICDKRTMANIMREMYYDSDCVPLGQLTLKQIKQGYSALNKIAEIISNNGTGTALVLACDEFYSSIPHNFGKKCPPIIQTKEEIEEKLNMLEALFNIRIATKALHTNSSISEKLKHPLSRFYEKLHCTLKPLDSVSDEYKAIHLLLKDTHGPTHSTYELEIIDLFLCYPVKEQQNLPNNNTFLLWHGSRITNWAGILKEGLRIAPLEAPISGDMFGKGLYFADTSSKSANYCFPTRKENQGLLLLCEVCMGNMLHLMDCNPKLPEALPPEYDSVFGVGRNMPYKFSRSIISSIATIPIGPLQEEPCLHTALNYNEYVVYDINRVKMKYLLRIQFNFKQ